MIRFSAAKRYVCQQTVRLYGEEDNYCRWASEAVILQEALRRGLRIDVF